MNKSSDWAVLRCNKCNQIFATPSVMISKNYENYKHLICPYCGNEGTISKEIFFIDHQTMNCDIKKIIKWEIE